MPIARFVVKNIAAFKSLTPEGQKIVSDIIEAINKILQYLLSLNLLGIYVDTTNFDNILSELDDTFQKALDTIDDHTHPGSEVFFSISYFIMGIPENRLTSGIANGIISLVSDSESNLTIDKIEIFAQSVNDLTDDTTLKFFIGTDLGAIFEEAVLTHNSSLSDYYLLIESGKEIEPNGKIYIRSNGMGGHGNISVNISYK